MVRRRYSNIALSAGPPEAVRTIKSFRSLIGAALAVLIVGIPVAVRAQQVSGSPHDSARSCAYLSRIHLSDSLRVLPGTYQVTVVATKGQRAGHTASGVMQLWATSANDRSPTFPAERPPRGDTIASFLYGATNLDWFAMGDPVQSEPGAPTALTRSTDVPSADSRDPLHPGVLGVVLPGPGPQGATLKRGLLIGTLGNRRVDDCSMFTDGGGVVLWIDRISSRGFSGTWAPYGILAVGSGHYRAERTGS